MMLPGYYIDPIYIVVVTIIVMITTMIWLLFYIRGMTRVLKEIRDETRKVTTSPLSVVSVDTEPIRTRRRKSLSTQRTRESIGESIDSLDTPSTMPRSER